MQTVKIHNCLNRNNWLFEFTRPVHHGPAAIRRMTESIFLYWKELMKQYEHIAQNCSLIWHSLLFSFQHKLLKLDIGLNIELRVPMLNHVNDAFSCAKFNDQYFTFKRNRLIKTYMYQKEWGICWSMIPNKVGFPDFFILNLKRKACNEVGRTFLFIFYFIRLGIKIRTSTHAHFCNKLTSIIFVIQIWSIQVHRAAATRIINLFLNCCLLASM